MKDDIHPLLVTMRALRHAIGLSLTSAASRVGVPAIVLGSYERGDRQPPLPKIEQILNAYGYTLMAVPCQSDAVRLPTDMASELRAIAHQLEQQTHSGHSAVSAEPPNPLPVPPV